MKKQTKLSAEIQSSSCLYKKKENKSFSDLLDAYQKGILDKYNFIMEMQKKYTIFFEFQKMLRERNIASLTIEQDFITIHLNENDVKFVVDNACRSALFELLNFGSYEHDEMRMIKNLLGDKDTFFDIGSHLGWYSVTLAKHQKNAKFYAFEPIANTYALLKRNVSINGLDNVLAFNFGLSNQQRLAEFYYSEIGSAVASEKDIFDVETLDTVSCDLKRLDDFVESEKIQGIDFIKCDVEGSEFLVIKGGEKSIRHFLPMLFLELVEDWCNKFDYTISDVTSLLFSIGYKMFEIKGDRLEPLYSISPDKIDNFNFLFLHEKKHKNLINIYTCK